MTRFRSLKTFAALSGVAMAALACGGGGGNGGSGSSDTSKGEIIVGNEMPTSGADASSGLPAQQGSNFYITQHPSIKGFKLTFLPLDDAVNGVHNPQKGAQNVQQFIDNNKVLGMVGPFNSGVAAAEIPIANRASLAMISPSNTNECLTQDLPYCQQANGFTPKTLRPAGGNNYFRIAAADTAQGPAMADFLVDTLKVNKVAVFSDNEIFGKGVADTFSKELVKKGGTVVVRQDFDKTATDFKAFLNDAKSKGAQAIYAGATSATHGCLPRAQMKGIFTTDIFYTGPDGIGDTQCIKDSADQANDKMYSTNGSADASQNPDAKPVIAAYTKAYPKKEDVAAYTFPAYDCMGILVDAIGRAIDANGGKMPTRAQVVEQMGKTSNFKGATSTYSFTPAGDPTAPTLAVYQVKSGDWAFVKQFAVGG